MATTEKLKRPANAKILKDFFGFKKGESLKQFAGELKELSSEEKIQLADGIWNESYNY